MILKMREYAPVVIVIATVAFVGTIFFSWGMDFTGISQGPGALAKIDGKDISMQSFSRMVEEERQKLRQQYGDAVPSELEANLQQQVLETQIGRIVHQKEFDRMGLHATADEIYFYLKNNPPPDLKRHPAFMAPDSSFDTAKYTAFLNDPKSFENEGMRSFEAYLQTYAIPFEKFQSLISTAGNLITSEEIAREYRETKGKAVFEYASVPASAMMVDSSSVTSDIMQAWYTAHQDSFKRKEQADLYFVKIDKKPSAEDEKLFVDELAEVKQRILSNESAFADEAKYESEDEGSAKLGGELGWFGKGQMVPEFETAARALTPGQISEPVRTAFGYHLIMLDSIQGTGDSTRLKARHILKKIAPTPETLDNLTQKLEDFKLEADTAGFTTAARRIAGLMLDSTGLFEKGSRIANIEYLRGVGAYAFGGTKEDSLSTVLDGKNALYVFKVKRVLPKGVLAFADAKESIRSKILDSLKMQKAKEHLTSLLSKSNGDIAGLVKTDAQVLSGTTDTVTRKDYVPNLGVNSPAAALAFTVPLNTVSKPIAVGEAYAVIKPLWRQELAPVSADESMQIAQSLSYKGKQKAYYDWYSQARKGVKVENNLDRFFAE